MVRKSLNTLEGVKVKTNLGERSYNAHEDKCRMKAQQKLNNA